MQLVYYVEDKSIKYEKNCNKTMLFCITHCIFFLHKNNALKSYLPHFIFKSFAPDSIDFFSAFKSQY